MQDHAISDAKKKEKENQLKAKGEEGQVKQREMMAFGQTASKILEDKRQRLTTELTEDVNKALTQVAKNKYTMVFVKPQVPSPGALIFSEGLDDVTQQVLGILNKDAPAAKKEEKK
jgi:Skp family chaperone for outer membrane proteins